MKPLRLLRTVACACALLLLSNGCGGDGPDPPDQEDTPPTVSEVDPGSNTTDPDTPEPGNPEEPKDPEKPDPTDPPTPEDPPKPPPAKIALADLSTHSNLALQIGEASGEAARNTITLQDKAENFEVIIAVIDPLMSSAEEEKFQSILSSGKKLILVGSPPGGVRPPCTTLVRPDERAIGDLAGKWIIEELARQAESTGRASIEGNVVQIRASDDDPASIQRYGGFIEILERHASVVFVHDGPGFWSKDEAKKRMQEALRIQKDIRIVFAHSDTMAAGAREAIDAYRKAYPATTEISVISVGGGIEESGATASISLRPLAEKAAEFAHKLALEPEYEPPSEITVAPASMVIDSEE